MLVPSVELMLIAGRAVFLVFSFVVAAIAFNAWRRSARAQAEQALAHNEIVLERLTALEAQLDATRASISQLGEHLERPVQTASTASMPAPGYQIAIRLAKGGASPEELMASCGLSLQEAELVRRLHGRGIRPASSAGDSHSQSGPLANGLHAVAQPHSP